MNDAYKELPLPLILALLFGIGIPTIRGCAAAGWIGPPEHDYALDRQIAYCVSLEPKYRADCLYPPAPPAP
jgi:hypothetical protein